MSPSSDAPLTRNPAAALVACISLALTACAGGDIKPGEGVNVGDPSMLRKIVPAEQLEQSSATQYAALLSDNRGKGTLAADDDPQLGRLRRIAARITPEARRFNDHASKWAWEVNLIRSSEINAFCMPGGKIAFYTGIIDTLKLSDDEIAVVMGHEMAHALREHGREQIAKAGLTNVGTQVLTQATGDSAGTLVKTGAGLLTLKFSRDDETDADLVGLELAARAGFDPRAGVSLWKKMAQAAKGAPMEWFSTHPSSDNRVATIERNLPAVLPLYKEARATRKSA